jgi:hypothetical protein
MGVVERDFWLVACVVVGNTEYSMKAPVNGGRLSEYFLRTFVLV